MEREIRDGDLYESRFKLKERKSNHRFIVILLIIVLAVLSLRLYFTETFGRVDVSGPSMNKTLNDGDKLLMKYTDGDDLKRGDVIIIYVEPYGRKDGTTHIIKRLIATEGEKVKCVQGNIYICRKGQTEYDSKPLNEPYAYYGSQARKLTYNFDEYVVGDGEVFFLGDNRFNSVDSRYMQPNGSYLENSLYKESDVVGVVPDWAIKYKSVLNFFF